MATIRLIMATGLLNRFCPTLLMRLSICPTIRKLLIMLRSLRCRFKLYLTLKLFRCLLTLDWRFRSTRLVCRLTRYLSPVLVFLKCPILLSYLFKLWCQREVLLCLLEVKIKSLLSLYFLIENLSLWTSKPKKINIWRRGSQKVILLRNNWICTKRWKKSWGKQNLLKRYTSRRS